MYLVKWIVYGVAILLASGIAGILAGKIIGFSESPDDESVPNEYETAGIKSVNRRKLRMRLKRVRIGRVRVDA